MKKDRSTDKPVSQVRINLGDKSGAKRDVRK